MFIYHAMQRQLVMGSESDGYFVHLSNDHLLQKQLESFVDWPTGTIPFAHLLVCGMKYDMK